MARTDHDSWGPATSVGATATLVATARALATRTGMINDPFAESLVSAVGLDFFSKVASGEVALSDVEDNNGLALLGGGGLLAGAATALLGPGARAGKSLAAPGWRTVVTDIHKLFGLTGLPGLRRQDLNGAPVAGCYVRAVLAWSRRNAAVGETLEM